MGWNVKIWYIYNKFVGLLHILFNVSGYLNIWTMSQQGSFKCSTQSSQSGSGPEMVITGDTFAETVKEVLFHLSCSTNKLLLLYF